MTDKYQYIAVDTLIPYANNARTHSDEQVKQIQASIREFGFINPVLVDSEHNIIAGHGRVMAAKAEGMDTVPCIIIDHLSEAQQKAYMLADNKLALNAGWDLELLKIELEDLKASDFNIELTGFDFDEVADICGIEAELHEDEYEIIVPEQPKAKRGDLYQLGTHRLLCGDATSAEEAALLIASTITVWTRQQRSGKSWTTTAVSLWRTVCRPLHGTASPWQFSGSPKRVFPSSCTFMMKWCWMNQISDPRRENSTLRLHAKLWADRYRGRPGFC